MLDLRDVWGSIFIETEKEHILRLYGRMEDSIFFSPRRQTIMRRRVLRELRWAHIAGCTISATDIKSKLDTNVSWEVASMDMPTLENELQVRWDDLGYVPTPALSNDMYRRYLNHLCSSLRQATRIGDLPSDITHEYIMRAIAKLKSLN
jgi:hypothetical protein